MRRQPASFGWGPGHRTATYVRSLKEVVDVPFQTPWWYAMTAATAVTVVGVVIDNAVALIAGLATGGFFIAFWICVGTLEHLRHRRDELRSSRDA